MSTLLARSFSPSPLRTVEDIQALILQDMTAVEQAMAEALKTSVPLIDSVAFHLIGAGGKRLRPLLTLICAKVFQYEGTRHINLAACVEFIHSATLLHDDVIDESALRRGKKTANAVWGNATSVLVGDFLFSRAFECMVADGDLDVLKVLSQASSTIAAGEVDQMACLHKATLDEAHYLRIIQAKTAALFEAACVVGGLVNQVSLSHRTALKTYGWCLGTAFQLIDDLLDYTATSYVLGKNPGDDLREGKVTLPLIHAYQTCPDEEKPFWEALLTGRQQDVDFGEVQRRLDQLGSYIYTRQKAQEYGTRALKALEGLPDNIYRQALQRVVDLALERTH
jgi:octaprenyl-diphosphate synthase